MTESREPYSVKEIAEAIHVYERRREQRNLEGRIRRGLKTLEDETRIVKELHYPEDSHIPYYKYKLVAHAEGQQLSAKS